MNQCIKCVNCELTASDDGNGNCYWMLRCAVYRKQITEPLTEIECPAYSRQRKGETSD